MLQKEGLTALKQKENIYVLQHSELQKNYITKNGFDQRNIFRIIPPVSLPNVKDIILRDEILQFIATKKDEMLLISTAARVDYFKNFDFLIKVSVKILEDGVPLKVLIAGDPKEKEENRIALTNLIPDHLKEYFLVIETLPQNELYSLFKLCRNKATFVCSSRYETLGITPLEAALIGVYTIIPNSKLVEASQYFSEEDKFYYVSDQLENILKRIYDEKRYISNHQSLNISELISYKYFEKTLLKSLQKIEQKLPLKLLI
ncbi:glycosyltransferase [Shouchella tritolerans]|uniref:glycosyltransferase n=1 Tax=Shouchella tritolerans TaxID=2979466 RepID=UPI0021E9730C|nr:glycosyltransferase [Shouchella tritolerans]